MIFAEWFIVIVIWMACISAITHKIYNWGYYKSHLHHRAAQNMKIGAFFIMGMRYLFILIDQGKLDLTHLQIFVLFLLSASSIIESSASHTIRSAADRRLH